MKTLVLRKLAAKFIVDPVLCLSVISEWRLSTACKICFLRTKFLVCRIGTKARNQVFVLYRKPEKMKTIVIANQKGGSGKSTATVHLAVAAEQAGDGPVIISDTDPQGSTVDWFNQRKRAGLETPRYAPLAFSELKSKIRALSDAGAEYLFIDTAPTLGAVNADLFAIADLILMPLNPTPADLRAVVKGLPAIKQSGKPFSFVLARVRANLKNNEGTAAALEALGLVLSTRMHERLIYAESFSHGKTAFEIDPEGIAALELNRLWKSTKARMAESQKTRKPERQHEQATAD
jgi:chromosome partitioning protein